jgi:HEPN domain-containing protein
MTKENIVQAWLDHVHEDIGAAECMLKGGYLLYVAFLCHQALEKALKAYYAAHNADEPPYTHSHIRLLDVCGLKDEISPEHMKFLTLMGPMYIKARYPEQKAKVARTLTEDGCLQMIETTKELTQWIEERLPGTKPLIPSDATSKS